MLVACPRDGAIGLTRRSQFVQLGLVARSVLLGSRGYSLSLGSAVSFLTIRSVLKGLLRVIIGSLTLLSLISPSLLIAQYTERKIGEYDNFAVAATNGRIYAGYNRSVTRGP